MKNRALRALLIGLCVTSLAPAAETAESQLKAFQKAATAALAKNPATPGDRRGETATYTLASLAQLATATSSNSNPQELERAITSIVVLTQNDPDVVKAAETLIATTKAERQARGDRARAEVDTLLKQTGDACLAAKVPADLDAALTALAPYGRNSGYDRRTDDQESWQRGSNAYRFVTRWQDYLAALGQRNMGEVTNILRELSNSVDIGVMPRSQIVALLAPPSDGKAGATPSTADPRAEIAKQLEKARTLEEFIAVSRALRATNPNRNQYEQTPLQQVLSNLIEDRQQVLAGIRSASLFSDGGRQFSPQDPSSSEAIQSALIGFRRETQFAGIRLALTGTKLPESKVDDTLDSYIIRAVENLVADKNWLQVRETLELYRTLFINSNRPPTWVTGDIEGCTAYLSARNLDLAEQYPAAVASYRRALRSAGRYTPVEAISARLAELKKSNPEAFTQADSASDPDSNQTYRGGQPGSFPPGSGPSIPRSPGGLRPAAPTGPLTPAPTTKPATTTP